MGAAVRFLVQHQPVKQLGRQEQPVDPTIKVHSLPGAVMLSRVEVLVN
jgi:hypothetical protein